MVNVNSFMLSLRVVDASGEPIPSLTVTGPTGVLDVKAGIPVVVDVTVTNENNGAFRITDAVPVLVAGAPVLSGATAGFDVPIGEAEGVVDLLVRVDARIGDNATYEIDLVAEAA